MPLREAEGAGGPLRPSARRAVAPGTATRERFEGPSRPVFLITVCESRIEGWMEEALAIYLLDEETAGTDEPPSLFRSPDVLTLDRVEAVLPQLLRSLLGLIEQEGKAQFQKTWCLGGET